MKGLLPILRQSEKIYRLDFYNFTNSKVQGLMKKTLKQLYYSFPIRLFLLHLQKNTMLLAVWTILLLWITGTIGKGNGMNYLFLDPEYMGKVWFGSFFILGLSFGGFLMVWNLTTYMLHSFRFPFLASLKKPFLVFCVNNIIFPAFFLLIFLVSLVNFQNINEFAKGYSIFYYVLFFLLGIILMLLFVLVYFVYTNKDVFKFVSRQNNRPPAPSRPLPSRRAIYKLSDTSTWQVDFYINEKCSIRRTRAVTHYDPKMLLKVFRQHHKNSLFFQFAIILSLMLFAYMMDRPLFRIPAGASIFLLATLVISIIGAVKYWFKGFRVITFIAIIMLLNLFTATVPVKYKNKAHGLDYHSEKAPYNYTAFDSLASNDNIQKDTAATIQILNNWRKKFPDTSKPKLYIITSTGGGSLATAWTTHVLQQLHQKSKTPLLKKTALMTGASGGMIGLAYMREVYLESLTNSKTTFEDAIHFQNMGSDLQNSVAFSIAVNDVFVPWVAFKDGDYTYYKDRGYMFEQQLMDNSQHRLEKRLRDYQQPEANADIPMLFVTPVIASDARKLIISPQGVSYMMRPITEKANPSYAVDAIDFRKMFAQQDADNLKFTSALRMSATYPYILPNVSLPSSPVIEAIDAGWRDNFGAGSATRFAYTFQDWIKKNTNGVILIQISSIQKKPELETVSRGIVDEWFNALSGLGQMMQKQDFYADTQIEFLSSLLGENYLDVIRFEYKPSSDNDKVSLSFHLTSKERKEIKRSFEQEKNQAALKRFMELDAN